MEYVGQFVGEPTARGLRGASNLSNGFGFIGQVKGIPAVIPSGNVFTGLRTGSVNQVLFPGVHSISDLRQSRGILSPYGIGARYVVHALSVPSGHSYRHWWWYKA